MAEDKTILIINPGSTSLKFKVFKFPGEHLLAEGKIERIGSEKSEYKFLILEKQHEGEEHIPHCPAGVDFLLDTLSGPEALLQNISDLSAIGFKTVHAGAQSMGPGAVYLTNEILNQMKRFETAAPVHNRAYLDTIECFQNMAPDIPLVGLFEPTFHNTITEEKYTCGIPFDWREQHGLRRYGFHGASHRYISERAPIAMGWSDEKKRIGKLVSCHLGGSSSLCAIQGGKSVDTTMEFSPQSGIVHSSRCETIDPFLLLFVQKQMGLSPEELSRILCRESGLKGISGISGDMRDLHEWNNLGNTRARLALNVFYHQVRKQIAAMAASLNGLDALVFTGGIGERGCVERREICKGLAFLGVKLNEDKNEQCRGKEHEISLLGSLVEVWVIPTNEELIVAREVYQLVTTQQ